MVPFRIAIILFCLAALPLLAQEPVTWTTGTYQYDGSGNVKFIDGRPYRYDELGRLTRAQVDATHAETFTYDDFGNLLTIQKDGQAAVALGVNQATNRLTDTTANAHAQYNADGSIKSTVTGDTFAYDGLGMVTESKVAGTRRLYLYSASEERIATVRIQSNNTAGTREWTIRNPSGAVLTRFTQTAAGTWSWDQDYVYANGQLLAAKVSGPEKVRHFFPDHLDTPRVITGNGGMELSRHTYYAYGEEVTSTASTERLKFTGHERDDPTLDYMHARYYAPMWGRFLSVDPGKDWDPAKPQSWNLFAYVRNNPLVATDPTGKSHLVYNDEAGYLALYSGEGVLIGAWRAANNVDSSASGAKIWEAGVYRMKDTTAPNRHSASQDSVNGEYGTYGIFRAKNFVDSTGTERSEMGVHSGRQDESDGLGRTGVEHATFGCIRTTEPAMETITETAAVDPLTTIEVQRGELVISDQNGEFGEFTLPVYDDEVKP